VVDQSLGEASKEIEKQHDLRAAGPGEASRECRHDVAGVIPTRGPPKPSGKGPAIPVLLSEPRT